MEENKEKEKEEEDVKKDRKDAEICADTNHVRKPIVVDTTPPVNLPLSLSRHQDTSRVSETDKCAAMYNVTKQVRLNYKELKELIHMLCYHSTENDCS